MKKNIIKLLLTLGITPLLVNCTGTAPLQTQLPSVHQTSSPTIGTPVYTPNKTPPTVVRTSPDPRQNTPQRSKHGQSAYYAKFQLPPSIKESSGLIKVDGKLWTHNDSGGKAMLYQVNERTGKIVKTIKITNAHNRDWEDIAYDDTYVYIGDFGNNRGNRKDLKVYKIPRSALSNSKSVRAEVINFSFSDQKGFQRAKPKQTNFDCEAMVALNGKLYLFSKNWQNQQTRLYELSSQAGKHKANYISSFNTQGMVTGAAINKEMDILLLTTYSPLLNVNVWAFTNFKGHNLLGGNAKRLNFANPLSGQIEGVTFTGNHKAYLSSEGFQKYIFSFSPTLYSVDFSGEFE